MAAIGDFVLLFSRRGSDGPAACAGAQRGGLRWPQSCLWDGSSSRRNPGWRKALDTRTYYFLYKWTWYEWLGALAPLVLFWLLWRFARKHGATLLARFALAVLIYGVFQQALAMVLLWPGFLVR